MNYRIKINEFEGPLNLLLHLVKVSDIDIQDININEITTQYLDYIHQWQELNIDIASEYLVMAATLMEIKSKSLLPCEKEPDLEVEEESLSRENLIQRLVEYQRYKEITKEFKTLEQARKTIYTKAPTNLSAMMNTKFTNDTELTIDDLMSAFVKFLERIDKEKPLHTKITNKEYSVDKRKKDIIQYLEVRGKVEFAEIIKEYNKSYIIVTFLSILELAKEAVIILVQENNFEKIMIERR